MIVYVNAESGNVFIREGPSRLSPSIKIPAYNFKKYGVLYECDDIRDNSGVVWYHLRGLGWAMAEFFNYYAGDMPDGSGETDDRIEFEKWVVGLNYEEVQQCIDYLQAAINKTDGVD